MYLDDGAGAAKPVADAVKIARRVKQDLALAGFVVNDKKSDWQPKQRFPMLGLYVDLLEGKFTVPQSRIVRFESLLGRVCKKKSPLAKEIAALTGHILSMSLALGPVCRLWTRGLYDMILNRRSWMSKVTWSPQGIREAEFWSLALSTYNGQLIWLCQPASEVVMSDASSTGWGGVASTMPGEGAHGEFSVEEQTQSSTWRELKGALGVLQSFAQSLQGRSCILRLDNNAAVHIIQKGSRHDHLQELAVAIFGCCRVYAIRLSVEWLPREENELADYLSKIEDEDDWQVNPH